MKDKPTELEPSLQQWRVTTPLPPRFQEGVWNRIERAHESNVSLADAFRAWLKLRFAQPAFATAYITVLLVAGLAIGYSQAAQKRTADQRQLQTRYVKLVDPYQRGH